MYIFLLQHSVHQTNIITNYTSVIMLTVNPFHCSQTSPPPKKNFFFLIEMKKTDSLSGVWWGLVSLFLCAWHIIPHALSAQFGSARPDLARLSSALLPPFRLMGPLGLGLLALRLPQGVPHEARRGPSVQTSRLLPVCDLLHFVHVGPDPLLLKETSHMSFPI